MKKIKTIAFWVASFTWGLPMSLIGGFISIALLIIGVKPEVFHGLVHFKVGKNWGGLNCGCFFFTDNNPSLHTKQHECGHGIQNIIFGWFMPFVVGIPSGVRYWYRRYLTEIKKMPRKELKPYDSIWFEGWATAIGEKYFSEKR